MKHFLLLGSEEALESVGGWLSRLGLSHYEASFLANGYDDIRFIVSILFIENVRFMMFKLFSVMFHAENTSPFDIYEC